RRERLRRAGAGAWAGDRRAYALPLRGGDCGGLHGSAGVARGQARAARLARVGGRRRRRIGLAAAAAVEPAQRRRRPELPVGGSTLVADRWRWPDAGFEAAAADDAAAAVADGGGRVARPARCAPGGALPGAVRHADRAWRPGAGL